MNEQAEAAQVLEDAADLLLIHGRCTSEGHDSSGGFCALGAIAEVVRPGWWVNEHGNWYESYWSICEEGSAGAAVTAVATRVPRVSALDDLTVSHWNDVTDDDFEVIDTLRRAAKDLRNEATA